MVDVHVELDEEEGLVANVGEEVSFADEVENVGAAKSEEVREGTTGLVFDNVPVKDRER
jgi:hypothetical protein